MKLVIDVGNTNTKIGIFENNRLIKVHVCLSKPKEIKECFSNELKHSGYVFEKAIVGSVAPSLNEILRKIIEKHYSCNVKILTIDDFNNYFDLSKFNKKEIGLDIIGLGLYLQKEYKKAIGICFGTATFSIAINNKKIIGVSIMPSIEMGYSNLFSSVELISKVPFIPKTFSFGTNTESALASGMAHMVVGTINQIYTYAKNKYKLNKCIITGGKLSPYKKLVGRDIEFINNCVLIGYSFIE